MTNHDLPSRYTHEYRDDIGAARTELARTRNRVRAGQDVSVDLIVEAAEQLIDRWVRQRKVTEHARDEFNAAIDSEIRIRQRLRAILDTVAGLTFDTADSSDDLVPVEPERPPRSIAASSLDQAEIGIRALGPFEVWRRGRRLECGRGTKAFRLGRYLLTQPARPIQRDVLLELFWPEGNPDAGRRNLHQAVYVLRKLLELDDDGTKWIVFEDDTYRFAATSDCWSDVSAFDGLLDGAETARSRGDVGGAREGLETALALYEGDFLEDVPYDDWPYNERRRLRDRFAKAALTLAELRLQEHDASGALRLAQRLLTFDQSDETAHCMAMRCYAELGSRRLVDQQYGECRDSLERMVGADPAPETRQLYRSLTDELVSAV